MNPPGFTNEPFSRDLPTIDSLREHWLSGAWRALLQPKAGLGDLGDLRGISFIVAAAAALQCGERRLAREHSVAALADGASRSLVADVLMNSVRLSLGRAAVFAGEPASAIRHFERSVLERRSSSEARRVSRMRLDEAEHQLQAQRGQIAKSKPMRPAATVGDPRLAECLAFCVVSPDIHDAIDWVLRDLLSSNEDRVRFLIVVGEHFMSLGDAMTATHFLSAAKEMAAGLADPSLQAELAKRLVTVGQPVLAVDLFLESRLAEAKASPQAAEVAQAVESAYRKVREQSQQGKEHGHELLLRYLGKHLSALKQAAAGRQLSLVEIGTTREDVPSQGSTRKIAEFCKAQGLHFVTVDMDPHNSAAAKRLFSLMDVAFEALTMKGEDYLRERVGPLDFVFLDAYDFDHGMHSELRQQRYEKFLGSRIDELACHQMHLDCARSVVKKMSEFGVVCVDDTWLEGGRWTAKGTLAMPFLLEEGFELVEARNRAALLKPGRNSAA